MKSKLAVALMLCLALTTSAQAGIISIVGFPMAGVSEIKAGDDVVGGYMDLILGVPISVALVAFGINAYNTAVPFLRPGAVNSWQGIGITLIIMSADGKVSKDVLAQTLAKAYPFIDNGDTLSDLAQAIRDKVPPAGTSESKAFVSLTEDETRSALISANLSEEQIQRVVNDLK